MEMRLRHWCGALVTACATVAVVTLPPTDTAGPDRMRIRQVLPETRTREALGEQLRAAKRNLHIAERTAVVLDRLNAEAGGRRRIVLVDPEFPTELGAMLESRIDTHWDELGLTTRTNTVRVVVHGGYDTVADPPSIKAPLPRIGIRLPSHTDGRTCMVFITLDGRSRPGNDPDDYLRRMLDWRLPDNRVGLSTCAFYAAFGQPGPTVERWLERHGLHLATVADWTAPRPVEARPVWLAGFGYQYDYEPVVMACAAGRVERCTEAILDPAGQPRSYAALWPIGRNYRGFASTGSRFLSDLYRAVGEDAFVSFWTSERAIPDAFEAATGEPIGQWTMRWFQSQLGTWTAGTRVSMGSVALTLTLCIALAAGSAWAVHRRQ